MPIGITQPPSARARTLLRVGQRAAIELAEIPGRGAQHVAFSPAGAADSAQMMFVCVDRLENAVSRARPGRDPWVLGVELGQLLAPGTGVVRLLNEAATTE